MILNFVKNLIPIKVLHRLKYAQKFSEQFSLKNSEKIRFYYLDAPDYGNLGDQAIAYAIKNFAKSNFPEYEFCEILQKDFPHYINWLKNNLKPNDIIFLTGGGNLGNLYRIYEATRRLIIKSFPYNKIFVFPQSICFTNNIFGRLSFNEAKKIYSRKNVTICCREINSLGQMKNLNHNVLFVPDIVLSLSLNEKHLKSKNRTGAAKCLRNDIEKLLTDAELVEVESIMKSTFGNDVMDITTMAQIDYINKDNREDLLYDKFNEFAGRKIIVTDRLHAMIFSVLTKTPCVVFDNNNHKISGTYDWIKEVPYVKLITKVDELSKAIKEVTSVSTKWKAGELHKPLINKIKE